MLRRKNTCVHMQDTKIVLYYYPMFEHCMEPVRAGVRACRTVVKRGWSEARKPTLEKLDEGDAGEAYVLHDSMLTSEDDEVWPRGCVSAQEGYFCTGFCTQRFSLTRGCNAHHAQDDSLDGSGGS